ncbi:Na+/H+ antiporter [Niabella beijingensis]|uniref:Na+/H+ antiporter n=1 Tax=Niabella beijingensis TaxID=2872700 RepID=UPI001CBE73D9|nr:Na+/H+ antiporter [Niabella beijingensis]MBZ4188579.1 Na+/H+ antiporter [Niabella beijingensis]
MIHDYLLISISVVLGVMLLVILGQKLRVAYPIFLVIAGLMISLIPGIPVFQINPDIVFLIFLPPILFEAAWFTSWRDFWKWKRPIFLLAFGLVLLTSVVVAFASSALIPGITLAMGFLLGGINSPPDAVAATSVLKHMKIPKRDMTILEGESLVNDASSLIVFKFALAAVMTGQFVFQDALKDFFIMAVMGVLTGLAIGFVFAWLLNRIKSNSNIDTVLTLIVPYVMYIVAEHFHFSGVLAVVAGGLMMSYHSHCFLSHTTRIQAGNVWNTLIFLINALIFVLIGLEMPIVIQGMKNYSIADGIRYAVILGGIIVATRIIWCYLIAFAPRWFSKKIRDNEPSPGWRAPLIMSFAAMRGVVSLASALAIPLLLPSGQPFPHRDILLFVTFVIIVLTLVGQGLLLPVFIKWMKIKEIDEVLPREKQEAIIQARLKHAALTAMNSDFQKQIAQNSLVNHQKRKLETDLELLSDKLQCIATSSHHAEAASANKDIARALIRVQRDQLLRLRHEQQFEDTVLRNQEMQLDLEEAKITGFEH